MTTLVSVAGAGLLLLGACSGDGGDDSDDPDVADLAHIHGLGINPADEQLYVASHHGVFLVTGEHDPVQIAGRTQDFMGFTIVGPDHFLGSGHPGPDDSDQPSNLGLIESTDAAETWTSVSLSGDVDFHAMDAKHDLVYGWDSQTGQLMVNADHESWDRRAGIGAVDITVSPDDPDVVLATTQDGPARSTDGGQTFALVDEAPLLVFVDWPSSDQLVGVDPDGVVHVSTDGGESWSARGSAGGGPQAILAHDTDEVYLATEDGIHHSTDGGDTFTVIQDL